MPARYSAASRHSSPRRSLSARGQLLNTFAGIWFCLTILLLALGGYMIEEQFSNPVASESAGLLFAAVLIATAITLLFCLLHPSRKSRHHSAVPTAAISRESRTMVIARLSTGMSVENRRSLPLHARYVDHARVVIQR